MIAAVIGKPDFSGVILNVGSGHIKIGNFFNALFSFVIVACVVYFGVVLPLNTLMARMKKPVPPPPPATKTCPECLSEIPIAAKRCAHCTQLVPAL
jgi:large conductance mechanosensitive channel